jgi:ABC-type sugar transport system substrate-binding protein
MWLARVEALLANILILVLSYFFARASGGARTRCRAGLLVLLLGVSATGTSPALTGGEGPAVACINPGWKNDQFWQDTDGAMEAAARELGVRLRIYEAPRPEDVIALIRQLADSPDRPDYILTTTQKGARTHLLEATEDVKIPTFIFNSGLLDEDRRRVGGPRERFKYWIGEMLPHEEQAGRDLANLLVDAALQAKRTGAGGRIRVLALGGTETDSGAQLRNEGLKHALSERQDAELLQIVNAHWVYEEARDKAVLMFRRYPEVDVLWCANDRMALGAIEAMRSMGREPGRDVIVGGMDWDARALSAVERGKMVASIGGQILEGAWALALLCDYYHGIDFASERVAWRSEMLPLTKETAGTSAKYLGPGNWHKLNIRQFSKFYNPDLKTYDFSIKSLIGEPGATKAKP